MCETMWSHRLFRLIETFPNWSTVNAKITAPMRSLASAQTSVLGPGTTKVVSPPIYDQSKFVISTKVLTWQSAYSFQESSKMALTLPIHP